RSSQAENSTPLRKSAGSGAEFSRSELGTPLFVHRLPSPTLSALRNARNVLPRRRAHRHGFRSPRRCGHASGAGRKRRGTRRRRRTVVALRRISKVQSRRCAR
ncbi:hypothetical protein TR75_00180, partial [Hydrogenibacillus schlegelii]